MMLICWRMPVVKNLGNHWFSQRLVACLLPYNSLNKNGIWCNNANFSANCKKSNVCTWIFYMSYIYDTYIYIRPVVFPGAYYYDIVVALNQRLIFFLLLSAGMFMIQAGITKSSLWCCNEWWLISKKRYPGTSNRLVIKSNTTQSIFELQ